MFTWFGSNWYSLLGNVLQCWKVYYIYIYNKYIIHQAFNFTIFLNISFIIINIILLFTDTETDIPPWISPEAFLTVSGQKQLAATCSGGHLKSYSHDGVRPNLPVPFRAKFRVKKRMSDDSHSSDKSRSISCTGDKVIKL